MEQVSNLLAQNQILAILVAVIGLIVFIFSIKITSKRIFATNRGVSAGRDINAPIMTGDINSSRTSILSMLANIATILALIVSTITLYVSYLALIK
ncbi:hypothetical protein H9J30_21365 [Shewanella sp. PS-2]|uniref:Uncharacterized protein n=2 Tax=Shewanella cutis TaxID=2766780 RepID=A0ABS9R3X1_9GAMM|nr:hypothetical protein [Shewanella sp. PS-2]